MACFLVPATEAVVTTVATKVLRHRGEAVHAQKLSVLSKMLWCASAVSACEHIYHGEVVASFPFLTALRDPESTRIMFYEMLTEGVAMAAVVTAVWCLWLAWSKRTQVKGVQEERV